MILITHAYSAQNSGDGLLVRLAVDRVRRAVPGVPVEVLAVDPQSFSTVDATVSPVLEGRNANRLLTGWWNAFGRRTAARGPVSDKFARADAVVAVGGGYLRAAGLTSTIKTSAVHIPQLRLASQAAIPVIYLPQSIGPFPRVLHPLVRRHLSQISRVYVRDDRSLDALRGLTNVERSPDLAVMEVARAGVPLWRPTAGPLHIIGRGLPDHAYRHALGSLAGRPDVQWWLQSSYGGNDDREFYNAIGVEPSGPASKLWNDPNATGTVLSVRLHGALEAILHGFVSVHLSYERKGWGAYEDLGIEPYVHNAFNFDLNLVLAQLEEMRISASPYKNGVRSSVDRIRQGSHQLDLDLQQILRP